MGLSDRFTTVLELAMQNVLDERECRGDESLADERERQLTAIADADRLLDRLDALLQRHADVDCAADRFAELLEDAVDADDRGPDQALVDGLTELAMLMRAERNGVDDTDPIPDDAEEVSAATMPDDSDESGTEDFCPKGDPETGNRHVPDWDTLHVESEGGQWYVDVSCIHCGRSGCVCKAEPEDIDW